MRVRASWHCTPAAATCLRWEAVGRSVGQASCGPRWSEWPWGLPPAFASGEEGVGLLLLHWSRCLDQLLLRRPGSPLRVPWVLGQRIPGFASQPALRRFRLPWPGLVESRRIARQRPTICDSVKMSASLIRRFGDSVIPRISGCQPDRAGPDQAQRQSDTDTGCTSSLSQANVLSSLALLTVAAIVLFK